MKKISIEKFDEFIIKTLEKFDTQSKELKLVSVGLVFAGLILIGIIVISKSTPDSVEVNGDSVLEQSVNSFANDKKKENTIISDNLFVPMKVNEAKIQSTDISKSIRQLFSSKTAFFKGASIDDNNEIHITLELNEQSYKWSIPVVEMSGGSVTVENIRLENALDCIFKPARNIFKKIPKAKSINVYIVTLQEIRNSYGHKTGNDKTVHCQFYLTKDSVEKLDWRYIQTLVGNFRTNDELKGYLDAYHFYTDYFSN